MVPFAIWAIATLAYPACFLVGILGEGARVQATAFALPAIVREGLLRLHVAALAAGLWAVAIGAGMTVLRRAGFNALTLAERALFGGGIGTGLFSLATLILGSVGVGPPWLFAVLSWALVLGMGWLGARELAANVPRPSRAGLRAWWRRTSRFEVLLLALGAAIVFVALTRANVPVFADYDSLEYHLGAPAQWWREGRITFLRDMVYANFPLNAEMAVLLAMNLVGGPLLGAAVGLQVLIGFMLLAAGAVAACGRRLHSPEAGRAAAAILLTTPFLAELVTLNSYFVELPQAAYGFLALFAFILWRREEVAGERWRYAALCGAMCGLAIGCKYPAFVFVLAPIGAFILGCGVAWPRQFWAAVRSAALAGAVALAVASPWFIRNAVNTGNPTYPLLYNVFGGRNWSPEQDAKFAAAHRPADLRFFSLAQRVWSHWVWRDQPSGGWSPPASPVLLLFALVPIALADRRSAWVVFCGGAVFLLAAAALRFAPDLLSRSPHVQAAADVLLSVSILAITTAPAFLVQSGDSVFLGIKAVLCLMAWYVLTHRLDRFLDPVSPAVALLGGMGLASLGSGWARRIGRGILAGGLAYALATTLLIHAPVMWVGLEESRTTFLRQVCDGSTYSTAAMEAINRLPEDATVLFVGEARTFYCRRRCIASSVFDPGPIERILEPPEMAEPPPAVADAPGATARRVRDGLRELGVTHIYVNWQELSRLATSYRYHFEGRARDGLPLKLYANLLAAMNSAGHLELAGIFGTDPQGRPRADFVLYALR